MNHVRALRGRCAAVALLGALAGVWPAAAATESGGIFFVDGTADAGLLSAKVDGSRGARQTILESTGTGVCLFDADGDGDLDLYEVRSFHLGAGPLPAEVFYLNDGRGHFRDATAEAFPADKAGNGGWGGGCAAGDIDNDGDTDLFISRFGANTLYRNEGPGPAGVVRFRDVTAEAGLLSTRRYEYSLGAVFFDGEGDGDLDLYVANYLDFDPEDEAMRSRRCRWKGGEVMCGPRGFNPQADAFYRNRGDGTFEIAAREAGLAGPRRFGMGVVAGDLDADGDRDLFVAADSQANLLWRNDGRGRFEEAAILAGVAYSGDGREQSGMGAELGDVDGDGDEDLIVSHFSDDYHTLYRNDGNLLFTDISAAAGLDRDRGTVGWGVLLRDFDNDGDLDLFIACGHVYVGIEAFDPATTYLQRNRLFENDGRGVFRQVPVVPGSALARFGAGRGVAAGDIDDDGDLDLIVTDNEGPFQLLRNESSPGRHFLRVDLRGEKSPRGGEGARLSLEAGGRRQFREARRGDGYLSASDGRAHFGLGDAAGVSKLEVLWPSGKKQIFTDLPADCELTIAEEGGLAKSRCGFGAPPAPVASSEPPPLWEAPASPPAPPLPPGPAPAIAPRRERRELLLAAQRATGEVLAGRYAAAIAAFESLLAELPAWQSPELGSDALGFGTPEAYRTFLAALYDNLAVAYLRGGRLPSCIEAVGQAIVLEPSRSQLRHNLGLCFYNARRFSEAVDALAAGLALAGGSAGMFYDLHRALAAAGRCAEAERGLEEALNDLPAASRSTRAAELFYLLGSCRAAAAEPGAEAHFRQALARDPWHAKARFKLQHLLQRRGYQPGTAFFAARFFYGRVIR